MNAAGRLAAGAAGLLVVLGGSYAAASAVVPAGVVAAWRDEARTAGHTPPSHTPPSHTPPSHTPPGHPADAAQPAGLSLAAGGYALSPVRAPGAVGEAGALSFRVLDAAGEPVADYAVEHEEDLHLVVVRADGSGFRHVHPALDPATGTWSIPWTWDAAGTYRVFADFTPAGAAEGLTLTRAVQVAGAFTPVPSAPRRVSEVDGFTVTLAGDLVAGSPRALDLTVTRDGRPVTTLQPYLGAFGHLVALREGDLAYLHVHAEGAEPAPGADAGPTTTFTAEAPTAGRYLLHLDFRVEDRVRTASFVVDAVAADPAGGGAHAEDPHAEAPHAHPTDPTS